MFAIATRLCTVALSVLARYTVESYDQSGRLRDCAQIVQPTPAAESAGAALALATKRERTA